MATEYVILVNASEIGDESVRRGWIEVARASGATPQAAIRAATDGKPAAERSGTFVAIPARSWKPLTRKVDTVEKDSWG